MVRLTERDSGQLALGGEPGGDRDPALEDEQPDPVGERAVGGRLAGAGAGGALLLRGEQPGELRGADRRGPLRHGSQSTFLELAMVAAFPSHRVSCVSPLPPQGAHRVRRSGRARLGPPAVQLYVGLALYGASSALLVEAGSGWSPGACCTRAWRS